MKFVEWNDSYSVGNVLMDAHHQVFFGMVKEFSESPVMDDPDAMMKRIAFLVEYTAMHLGAEEKLMQQAGYPEFEQHKEIHAFSLAADLIDARVFSLPRNPRSSEQRHCWRLSRGREYRFRSREISR